jgi:hypothetical protein
LLKETIRNLFKLVGLSLHRSGSVARLLLENERLKQALDGASSLPPGSIDEELRRLHMELRRYEDRQGFFNTAEDFNFIEKSKRLVDRLAEYGAADFADVAPWLFASSISNHRVIHQRFDEGSLLWRAAKSSSGPVLEVGRAAGGSTTLLLAATANRKLISIDRSPCHHPIVEHIFNRPDVLRRLILHNQTSRESIPESEFGMLFIDADHSYEGVSHDIAMFWNQLKPFDGKSALAVFHDAADNPIAYVPQVRMAVSELLAERGIARVVESWGSMLVLEKLHDLDQDRWFAKQNTDFWKKFSTSAYPILKPITMRGSLGPTRSPMRVGPINLLGDENIDGPSWIKQGVAIEMVQLDTGADNPMRLVREISETERHGIEKFIPLDRAAFSFSVFLRPHRLDVIRMSIHDKERTPLASVDFELGNASRIIGSFTKNDVRILDASFAYRNGYFTCTLSIALPTAISSAFFAINSLSPDRASDHYAGDNNRGFFMNLSSVREIIGA